MSLTGAMLAKSVWIPKTALKASACPPVFAVTVSAAAAAFAQVCFASASAPQVFVSASQMNWVMMSMFCAEPAYDGEHQCVRRAEGGVRHTVVVAGLVDGLERGLLPVVKADAELDLRHRAAAEIADAARARSARCSCSGRCVRRARNLNGSPSAHPPSRVHTAACERRTSTFDVALALALAVAVAVAVAVTESVTSTVTVTVCAAQLSESELLAIATLVVAAAVEVAAAVVASTDSVTPWSLTGAMLAKSVWIPNTALNASACPPVFAVTVSAAAAAVAQVCFARSSASQKLTSWSHMNCVMMSMFCAEPGQSSQLYWRVVRSGKGAHHGRSLSGLLAGTRSPCGCRSRHRTRSGGRYTCRSRRSATQSRSTRQQRSRQS